MPMEDTANGSRELDYQQAADAATSVIDTDSTGANAAQDGSGIEQGQNGANAQGQPTVNDFNAQMWPLKFRDKTIYPKDRDEMVRLAQQGYGYSQRMEELNRRAKEFEEREAKLKGLERYQQLDEVFQSNPDLYNEIQQIVQRKLSGVADGGSVDSTENVSPDIVQSITQQIMKQFEPVIQKVQAFEDRFSSIDEQRADEEVRKESDGLMQKYKDYDWETEDEGGHKLMWRVMDHAFKNGFKTLESAFKDMTYDTVPTRIEADVRKKLAEEQKNNKRQGIITGDPTGGRTTDKAPDIRNMGYNEIAMAAMERL